MDHTLIVMLGEYWKIGIHILAATQFTNPLIVRLECKFLMTLVMISRGAHVHTSSFLINRDIDILPTIVSEAI